MCGNSLLLVYWVNIKTGARSVKSWIKRTFQYKTLSTSTIQLHPYNSIL